MLLRNVGYVSCTALLFYFLVNMASNDEECEYLGSEMVDDDIQIEQTITPAMVSLNI
jgi:hypothetical protein